MKPVEKLIERVHTRGLKEIMEIFLTSKKFSNKVFQKEDADDKGVYRSYCIGPT